MPPETDAAEGWYDNQNEDNFTQPGDLCRSMNEDQRGQLFANIAGGLRDASASIQPRMIEQFSAADPAYGEGVTAALK